MGEIFIQKKEGPRQLSQANRKRKITPSFF
jgi:hypothetical protein